MPLPPAHAETVDLLVSHLIEAGVQVEPVIDGDGDYTDRLLLLLKGRQFVVTVEERPSR